MIAALFGVGVLTGGEEEEKATPEPALDVERVAHRLERIRELEFEHLPTVRTVSPDRAALSARSFCRVMAATASP
jgi:hypothetical protein